MLKLYDDPELQTKDKDFKLVKLRNPWGEKEWKYEIIIFLIMIIVVIGVTAVLSGLQN